LKKLKRINLIDENHFQNPYNYLNSLRETSPRAIFLDYKVFFLYEDVNKILLSPHVFGNNHVLPKCPHAKKLMESFPMGIESKSAHLKVKKKQIQNFYGSVNYQDLANSSFKKALNHFSTHPEKIEVSAFTKVFSFYVSTKIIDLKLPSNFIDFYDGVVGEHISNLVSRNYFNSKDELSADQTLKLTPEFQKSKIYQSFKKEVSLAKEIDVDSLFTFLSFASYNTTKTTVSFVIKYLLDNNIFLDKVKKIKEKEELFNISNEFIRLTSPVKFVERLAIEDFVINNFQIKKNDRLLLCLTSSNRDPLAFENPTKISFEKRKNTHLSFSKGQYYCTGAQISLDVISSLIENISSVINLFDNKDLIYKKNTFLILS
tara:strand:+ start:125 stop:1243 length:1119 start_codon:yes stop_codon:yes gene_type:complete